MLSRGLGLYMEDGPNPMLEKEARNSSLITAIAASSFFITGIIAARWWLISVPRFVSDEKSLKTRRLLLQILSLANILRASSLVIYAFSFEVQWKKHQHHKLMAVWHEHFDTMVLSFPSMVWESMLSVLLVFVVEIHFRTRMRSPDLLRPAVLSLNVIMYGTYLTLYAATLWLKLYSLFAYAVYVLAGTWHLLLSIPLSWYGCQLWRTLRQRESRETISPFLSAGSSNGLINRVIVIATILPMLEVVRGVYDLEYAHGASPVTFTGKFRRLVFIAFMRLTLEWVPSAVLLYAFRPRRQSAVSAGSTLVSPVLSPQQSHLRSADAGAI